MMKGTTQNALWTLLKTIDELLGGCRKNSMAPRNFASCFPQTCFNAPYIVVEMIESAFDIALISLRVDP